MCVYPYISTPGLFMEGQNWGWAQMFSKKCLLSTVYDCRSPAISRLVKYTYLMLKYVIRMECIINQNNLHSFKISMCNASPS